MPLQTMDLSPPHTHPHNKNEEGSITEDAARMDENAAHDDESCNMTTTKCITSLMNWHLVVVFLKPWCPCCCKALEALSLEGIADEPHLHVMNLASGGSNNENNNNIAPIQAQKIQNMLVHLMGGCVTVPNVFVGGCSFGGSDEMVVLHREGKLQVLLEEAGTFPTASGDGPPLCDDLTQEDCIAAMVQWHPVVLFGKCHCPTCKSAVEILGLEGVDEEGGKLHVIDLMQFENFSEIQDTLERMTGMQMVPNVFFAGKHIGGQSDLVALKKQGKLHPHLEQAKAFG